jgi:hypothetical protein
MLKVFDMLIRILAGHAFREMNYIGLFHSSRRLSSVKITVLIYFK